MAQQDHPDVSPQQIEQHLGDIEYPIGKHDLKQQAEESNAPYYVIEVIEQLPDRRYTNSNEVAEALPR